MNKPRLVPHAFKEAVERALALHDVASHVADALRQEMCAERSYTDKELDEYALKLVIAGETITATQQ